MAWLRGLPSDPVGSIGQATIGRINTSKPPSRVGGLGGCAMCSSLTLRAVKATQTYHGASDTSLLRVRRSLRIDDASEPAPRPKKSSSTTTLHAVCACEARMRRSASRREASSWPSSPTSKPDMTSRACPLARRGRRLRSAMWAFGRGRAKDGTESSGREDTRNREKTGRSDEVHFRAQARGASENRLLCWIRLKPLHDGHRAVQRDLG